MSVKKYAHKHVTKFILTLGIVSKQCVSNNSQMQRFLLTRHSPLQSSNGLATLYLFPTLDGKNWTTPFFSHKSFEGDLSGKVNVSIWRVGEPCGFLPYCQSIFAHQFVMMSSSCMLKGSAGCVNIKFRIPMPPFYAIIMQGPAPLVAPGDVWILPILPIMGFSWPAHPTRASKKQITFAN